MERHARLSIIYSFFQMSCIALNKNLHQCRNWTVIGKDFCHAHRSMNKELFKERWLSKYIIGQRQIPTYTIISPFNKEKILADLKSGIVTLTREDICKIPATEGYVDIYLLLLQHNFAQYGDHPQLERSGLWLYQLIMYHFPYDDRDEFQRSKLMTLKQTIEKYLITYSGKSLYNFFIFIGMAVIGRTKLSTQIKEYIPSLLDSDAAKELSWYSYDVLDGIRREWEECCKQKNGAPPMRHPLMRCLVERWLPDIKELYQTEKQIQKIKMDQCKEELMMDRWHPDRVGKLLEMGIDPEDM